MAADLFFSFTDILDLVWKKLETASKTRHDGWHLASVGTIRDNSPEIRTMVLRGAQRTESILWFHTDSRSPKLADLAFNPNASLLFYDPQTRWQLRLRGIFKRDPSSDLTDAAWKKTSPSARRCYQGPGAPSSVAGGPSTNMPEETVSVDAGRDNFLRLVFYIEMMEWLALDSEGHRRILWRVTNGVYSGNWLNP